MRISSNQIGINLGYNIQRINQKQIEANEKVVTGQNIAIASDNPSVVGEVQIFESQKRELFAYKQNYARAVLATEYTQTNLSFMQELSNESISALDLGMEESDYGLVKEQALRIGRAFDQALSVANQTLSGQYVFSGDALLKEPFHVYRGEDGEPQQNPTINQLSDMVEGTRYRIESLGVNSDFTNSGVSSNTLGTEFIYTEDSANPPLFDGATLSVLAPDISQLNQEDLKIGKKYRIESIGSQSNFLSSGATANQIGQEFVYNGAALPTWDGAILRPIEEGVSEANTDDLISGQTYRITQAGTDTDLTSLGAKESIDGSEFVYNGNPSGQWDGAVLIPVKPSSEIIASQENRLLQNQYYQILRSGSGSEDFTHSGSRDNSVGTQFAYNGTPPTWDGATLQKIQPDYNNPIQNGPLVDGKLYYIADPGATGDFSTGNELTPNGGSPTSAVGEVFLYQSGGAQTFDSDTVLYEFVQATETLTASHPTVHYLGSTESFQYGIAESSIVSPYASPEDNQNIALFLNRLLEAKDHMLYRSNALIAEEEAKAAMNLANEANDNAAYAIAEKDGQISTLQLSLVKDLISDISSKMDDSDDDIVQARSSMSAKQIILGIANSRDKSVYNNLEDQISRSVDANDTQAALELSQANQAYQSALQAGSKMMQLSLLDFI